MCFWCLSNFDVLFVDSFQEKWSKVDSKKKKKQFCNLFLSHFREKLQHLNKRSMLRFAPSKLNTHLDVSVTLDSDMIT